MVEQEIQTIIDNIFLTIIIIAPIIGIALFITALTIPLPPWYGLYGDEYKKWKEGKPSKQDNSD